MYYSCLSCPAVRLCECCVSSMKPHDYTLYQCCPLSWGIRTDIQPPLKPWPAGRKKQSRSYLGLSRKPVYSGSNEDWWHTAFCCQYNQWSSPLLTHNSLPSVWACEQWDLSQFCSFQFHVREDFTFWKIKICVRSINVWPFSLNAKTDEIRSGLLGQIRGYLDSKQWLLSGDTHATISQLLPCSTCVWTLCCLRALSACATADTPCSLFFEEELYWTGAHRKSLTVYMTNWIAVSDGCVYLNSRTRLVVPYVHMLMHMHQGLNMTLHYSRDVNLIFMHKVCFCHTC